MHSTPNRLAPRASGTFIYSVAELEAAGAWAPGPRQASRIVKWVYRDTPNMQPDDYHRYAKIDEDFDALALSTRGSFESNFDKVLPACWHHISGRLRAAGIHGATQ